jgi:acetoin utilization deacetylase AcuC-like enzyme
MTTPIDQLTHILSIFVNPDFYASNYEFDTTRKSKDIVDSLLLSPIPGVELIDPINYYEEAEKIISSIHSPEYVSAVRTGKPRALAQSSSFTWDKDIYTMARAHVAGMVAAAISALMTGGRVGSLSSGMHHSSFGSGSGFCTFNGLAAAIKAAIDTGVQRILCLDYDAHAGGGTWNIMQKLFPESVVQVDVTVSAFDTWTPSGDSRLDIVEPSEYRAAIAESLDYASSLSPFDLVIYNAGVDIRNSGVSEADLRAREKMVSDFIGATPAVFGLAGGYTWGRYNIDDVVGWHRLTINEWAKPR